MTSQYLRQVTKVNYGSTSSRIRYSHMIKAWPLLFKRNSETCKLSLSIFSPSPNAVIESAISENALLKLSESKKLADDLKFYYCLVLLKC